MKTEKELLEILGYFISDELAEYGDESDLYGIDVRNFEDLGLLTNDNGLVLRLRDGSEFQLTLKRSK